MKSKYVLFVFVICTLFLAFNLGAAETAGSNLADHLVKIMTRQTDEWNKGNFEGFMAPYWNSEKLTFQSGNTRRKGWENLLNMYQTVYKGEQRGVLTFTDIEVKPLTDELALVLGRWNVQLKDKKKQGLFTLIFKKIENQWIIIHDHSS
jgi:uncharacterized protein (TIGR02246 family)